MTIDTTKLRELAQNATPGPWVLRFFSDKTVVTQEKRRGEFRALLLMVRQPRERHVSNAAFIAAANPATVLALLDELDNNRKAMNAAKNVIKSQAWTISHMRSKADRDNEAVTTLDSERAANAAMTEEVDRLRTIEAAARNLAKVKGRHHSEIAMSQLLEALK